MSYRVTIVPAGKRPADGRFANAEPDSKGRFYRLFHYKAHAEEFRAEIQHKHNGWRTILTTPSKEEPA